MDESIIKGAVLDDCGTCYETIVEIIRRCDTVIFNDEWIDKCYNVTARMASDGSTLGQCLLKLLRGSFIDSEKLAQETEKPPHLDDERGIHRKDIWVVRLAVATGASLVTKDGPLHSALQKKGIPCLSPEDAIC